MSDFPVVAPTLNLDFANSRQLDPRITFRRASTGTYVDSDGLIKTAGINTPRFDHDPVTGVCKGLLVEESRTNLLTYSNSFTTFWTGPAASTTNVVSPAGLSDAWGLGNGTLLWVGDGTITAGTAYCFSFFAKSDTGTTIGTRFDRSLTGGAGTNGPVFDLSAGTATTVSGFSTLILSQSNGWYRCCVIRTASGSGTTGAIQVGMIGSSKNVFIYGAQLEAGSFPTSYIPTTASTVTRSADLASMTGTNFSSWYNQSEGTVFVDYEVRNVLTVMSTAALENNASNAISTVDNSNNALILANGVSQYQQATPAPLFGNRLRRAMGFATNNVNLSQNGVLYSRDSSVILPSINSFRIGTAVSANTVGAISRIAYWPKRLPDAQLQALTRR